MRKHDRISCAKKAQLALTEALRCLPRAMQAHSGPAGLMTSRTRHPEELKQIACPILFISGDEDIVMPPFAADAIARVVPGSKVAHIEDAGHSAYFERAQTFNAIVDEFFGHIK